MPHPTGRPWIVAHRGARSVAPENTIGAFRAAHLLGADAVELDVRRTDDGAVIVSHDAVLPETGEPVASMTRAQIRRAAPNVPDLHEAIEACDGMWIDIEVKNNPAEPDWDPEDRALHGVLEVVSGRGAATRVLVSSFNLQTVLRAAAAGLRTGWLLPRGIDPLTASAEWPHPHPAFALPSARAMGPGAADPVVDAFSAIGVEVGVWTVNDAAEMRRLRDAGVGAIFTDDVPQAVGALRA